jgi:hypothetical protein
VKNGRRNRSERDLEQRRAKEYGNTALVSQCFGRTFLAALPSVGNSSSSATSETAIDTGDDDKYDIGDGDGDGCADLGEIAAAEASITSCVLADADDDAVAWAGVGIGLDADVRASAGAAVGVVGAEFGGACFESPDGNDDDDDRLEASVGDSDRADGAGAESSAEASSEAAEVAAKVAAWETEVDADGKAAVVAAEEAEAMPVVSWARNCSASWCFGCSASARSSASNASLALPLALPSATVATSVADPELIACRARARR